VASQEKELRSVGAEAELAVGTDRTGVCVCSIPTINRKLNLQTHAYICIYLCMYERTCCLIDKWAQERERLTQRESERDQTKLIEINSRRTSVCMSVCVTARGMCEKTRPMTATAIKQTLAVVYMCAYIHILCGILECPSIFSSRGDFYVVFAPDTPCSQTRCLDTGSSVSVVV